MKIIKISLDSLQIPFVERFRHTRKDRSFSDTVIVRVETDTGVVGYGEGLPRPYVTGETVSSLMDHVSNVLWPMIAQKEIDTEDIFDAVHQLLPVEKAPSTHIVHNAARCAVELAVIDAALKSKESGLHDVLSPTVKALQYSGVITSGSAQSVYKRASQYKRIGLSHIKLKVGTKNSEALVAAAREALGERAILRLDANSAWTLSEAIAMLNKLEQYDIASCEEPLAARKWKDLRTLREATTIPLMADESLVTLADAQSLVRHKSVDLFNIRISKCGGIGPSLRIANCAREHGLDYQIGAHVGETAILSAVGRQLAAHLGDVRFLEGSYGTLLLTEDISRTSIRFGHKGVGKPIRGLGLGMKIVEEKIHRYSVQHMERYE